jgi:UDP-GlcNAc:undecaprenyl-phosphate GlcNAc-1-phosphate transferase
MIVSFAELVVLFFLVFLLGIAGTRLVRAIATRKGWVAAPRKDRWHRRPTALHGGAGFYPAFLLGALCLIVRELLSRGLLSSAHPVVQEDLRLVLALVLGSLIMFSLGLCDDVKQFRPATKLVGQLVAASIFIFSGGVFHVVDFRIVNILLTYFWFIGITNAVNMLDNMDGLSSGVVIIAASTLVALALPKYFLGAGGVLAVPVGLVFIAALLGFWKHNKPPASIFMGDSGSLFIGFVLAGLAIPSPLNGFNGMNGMDTAFGSSFALILPATIAAVPIFDTTFVTLTRIWRAQSPSQGGRDHSSHRLVGLGMAEKRAVWTLYGLAGAGGLLALLLQHAPFQSIPLIGLFGLMLVLAGVYLAQIKIQTPQAGQIPPDWTPLVSNLLYKKHAAEILLDLVLVVTCLYAAYLLRFGGVLTEPTKAAMLRSVPLVVLSCFLVFFVMGVYRGQWRLISVADMPRFAISAAAAGLLSIAVLTLATRFEGMHSRSAFIIFGLLVFVTQVGSRLSFRLFDHVLIPKGSDNGASRVKPILIYGAGKAGKLLFDEVFHNPALSSYVVVGFMDDNPNRVGRTLCGLDVRDCSHWVGRIWHRLPEVWVSSKFITDKRIEAILREWNAPVAVKQMRLTVEPVSIPWKSEVGGFQDEQGQSGKGFPARPTALPVDARAVIRG